MKKYRTIITSTALFISLSVAAQIDVTEKIKTESTNRVESNVDEGINKGLDQVENAIGSLFKKKNKKQTNTKEETETTTQESINNNKGTSTSLKSYSKYDFVPGDQILYFEDFSQDAIGDFPALWATNGGGEVKTVSIAPGHWFHMNKIDANYCYTKQIAFPQNFIVEFDVIPEVPDDSHFGFSVGFYEDPENVELNDDLYPGKKGVGITFEDGDWLTKGYDNTFDQAWLQGESRTNPVVLKQVNHVIIWVQNRRLRIYHQGAKALDVPTNVYAGTKFNRLRFSGWSTYGIPYITNIKVTTAAPDTRSKLITEGKLVSYGIYFDVNKDVVKPESYGTISDIAKVLKENPTVSIKIIGHTDSDGNDAANLDLSKRRAASVKNSLVSQFGIDGSRIQTDGKGETQPIVQNTSSENKAKNRRVEFIKL